MNLTRLSKSARKLAHVLEPRVDHERPRTRADCVNGARPCPFVGCRWHLAIDVGHLTIKVNFPSADDPNDPDLDAMKDTCALDVAARGGATLDEVGTALNLTRERARQIELAAGAKLRRRIAFLVDDEVVHPGRRHLHVVHERPRLLSPLPSARPTNVAVLEGPPSAPTSPRNDAEPLDEIEHHKEEPMTETTKATKQCGGCPATFAPPPGPGNHRYCAECRTSREKARAARPTATRRTAKSPESSTPSAMRQLRESGLVELLAAAGYEVRSSARVPAGLLLVVGGKQ